MHIYIQTKSDWLQQGQRDLFSNHLSMQGLWNMCFPSQLRMLLYLGYLKIFLKLEYLDNFIFY